MIRIILLGILFSISTSSIAQCAYDYEGIYGRKLCSLTDVDSNYIQQIVQIEAINSERILITNFMFNELWVTCDVEDSIFVNLDCSNMTLACESISYYLCGVGGYMSFNGEGQLYADSLRIQYTQGNPDGTTNYPCITYKKDAFVGIVEPLIQHENAIYPNPSTGVFHFKTEVENGTLAQILNAQGKLVDQIEIYNNAIDLKNLPNGYYLVRYRDSRRNHSMARLIKN